MKSHLQSKRHGLNLLHKEGLQQYKIEQHKQYISNYNTEYYLENKDALLAQKAEKKLIVNVGVKYADYTWTNIDKVKSVRTNY